MDNTALWESYEDNEFAGNCSYTLLLTTMAGTGIQIVVPVSIHHRWDMLEDYLVENLPAVSHLDTFGCELILLDADTHQETLWVNSHFHLVVQECFQRYDCKEQIRGEEYEDYPKAIRVPANAAGILPAKAFSSVAHLRHVKVDPGLHTIDREAWRYCHSLQIVKLPYTVVAVEYASFQGCFALVMVEMPGCVAFGVRLFSECCALEKVGILTEGACKLAEGAVIGPYAFESCGKLEQISLPGVKALSDTTPMLHPPAGIPQGCVHTSGIRSVMLGGDVVFMGHRAYENCKQLAVVDVSHTNITTLHMHTFSHCLQLERVSLPPCLREIRAEAFVGCKLLGSLALPEHLRYIGHRAFGERSELSCLHCCRLKRVTWRRPYAAYNAFEACYKLATPWWLHYLPPNGTDWMVPPSHHT